jgi:hypothetical protein
MRETETVLSIIGNLPPESDHWRARYGETRSAGSGRGRRKRTRTAGTSPAAYFTRRGAVGKGPVLLAPRRRPTLRHAGFGRRAEETDQSKDRHRASARPHRQWTGKFGQAYANGLRRRRPRPGDTWHRGEVFITINGKTQLLMAGG